MITKELVNHIVENKLNSYNLEKMTKNIGKWISALEGNNSHDDDLKVQSRNPNENISYPQCILLFTNVYFLTV